MFTTGLPNISLGFFSGASEAVAIPTAVQIFVFIVTLWAGRIVWSTPLLYGAGSLAIFVIGGLTGVMVAIAPFNWQAHRSEEHTSELQSLMRISYAVFCLKKKK